MLTPMSTLLKPNSTFHSSPFEDAKALYEEPSDM